MSHDDDQGPVDLTGMLYGASGWGGDRAGPAKGKIKIRWPRKNKESGRPTVCLENTEAMLKAYGVGVVFNLMTHEAEYQFRGGIDAAADMLRNASEAQIREWACEHGIYKAQRFADQMTMLIARKSYHPVADWIRATKWDGVDRFAAVFESLTIEAKFLERHEAIALRCIQAWLVTAAKAAMLPPGTIDGINAQGVLVLQGDQGMRKTRWLMSLVPPKSGWAKESVSLDPANRDSRQQATDAWIVELGEIDGTFRKADMAALKGFLTSRNDTYRKAYAKSHESIARRTVFVASVNARDFLVDETGSRRFWTLPVVVCNPDHGIDLQQLWAQAAYLAETQPDLGWLTAEEGIALSNANRTFEVTDPMVDDVLRVFKIDLESKATTDAVRKAIRPGASWTKGETISLNKALTRMKVPEHPPGKSGVRLWALKEIPGVERD